MRHNLAVQEVEVERGRAADVARRSLPVHTMAEEFAGVATWTASGLVVQIHSNDNSYTWTSGASSTLIVSAELHDKRPETQVRECLARAARDLLAALRNLTGGFALALCQTESDRLILATDHFGVRPLYYRQCGNRLVFGTRLASLLALADESFSIDLDSVYHYLNFTYVPGPYTIYQGTFVLPPGAFLVWKGKQAEIASYWRLSYPADATVAEEELRFRLRQAIAQAVEKTVPADDATQTMGAFLSGGTDSGTIAGLVSRRVSPLKAFSIAFGEDAYNELHYAKILARNFGLEHYVHQLTADELLESIPVLLQAGDQPFGNPSIVATWRCARLAAAHDTTLLLAGDGGDEIFGGNERYAKDYIYGLYHRLPTRLRAMLAAFAQQLPNQSLLGNRLRNFTYRGNIPNPERFYADDEFASKWWETLVHPALAQHVHRQSSVDLVRGHFQQAHAEHELDRLMYVDMQMAIWGNDLPKVRTATQAAGVRARFPFLDPDLTQCTGTLPARYKVRGLQKRYLFKRAVADILPQETLRKTKHGFGVPVAEWIRTDPRVRAAVLDPILDPRSFVRTCLTDKGLSGIVDEHRRGAWDHGMWLWALMMLERWLDTRRSEPRHG